MVSTLAPIASQGLISGWAGFFYCSWPFILKKKKSHIKFSYKYAWKNAINSNTDFGHEMGFLGNVTHRRLSILAV